MTIKIRQFVQLYNLLVIEYWDGVESNALVFTDSQLLELSF